MSSYTFDYYTTRDIAYKTSSFFTVFFLRSVAIEMEGDQNLFPKLSFLSLFFEEFPYFLFLKKSEDKKKLNTVKSCRILLQSKKKKQLFLLKLRIEFALFLFSQLKITEKTFHTSSFSLELNPYEIQEFLSFSSYYPDLPPLKIIFYFENAYFSKNKSKAIPLFLTAWLH